MKNLISERLKLKSDDSEINTNFLTANPHLEGRNFLTNSKWDNLMKRVTFIAVLVMALESITYAQKSGGAAVNLGANIVQGLIVGSPSGTLYFGDNASHTIVKGAVAGSDTMVTVGGTDSRAVNFSVTGDGGQSVTVTVPGSATLTGSVSGSLTFTPSAGYNTSNSDQTGMTTVTSGNSYSLGGGSYSTKTIYIWLGGTLSSPSNAAPGSYSGNISISVAYTGL